MNGKKSMKAVGLTTVLGLTMALCLVACSPKAPADQDAAGTGSGEEAPEVVGLPMEWSPDVDCAVCHVEEATTSGDTACLAGYHTATQGFDCMTCHVDDAALSEAHVDMTSGKVPKKLKKTEVDASLCDSCHDAVELKEVTAASTALTDSEGKVVNPHDVPAIPDHEKLTCVSCHKGHSTEEVQEEAQSYCIGCHHENVYECGTCHA